MSESLNFGISEVLNKQEEIKPQQLLQQPEIAKIENPQRKRRGKVVGCYVTLQEYDYLSKIASQNKISLSELMRRILNESQLIKEMHNLQQQKQI